MAVHQDVLATVFPEVAGPRLLVAAADGMPEVAERAHAEFPFGNMFTDARSLARMYAATVSEVDDVRLLHPAMVERMTVRFSTRRRRGRTASR